MPSAFAPGDETMLIGLDIGGTNLKAVAVDRDGAVLASTVVAAGGAIPREALLAIVSETVAALAGGERVRVGIAVGGTVPADGIMRLGTTNLPNLTGIPLAETFSGLLGVPCRADHDGRAAMRGEAWVGAARGVGNALTLTFGTAIGSGLLLDGRIHAGAHRGAGEIGVWRLGPAPAAGPWPTFEEEAAPGGSVFRARGLDYGAMLASPPEARSPAAAEVLALVGRAIANAHLLLDLDMVVLVGGVTAIGEPFRAAVAGAYEAACAEEFRHGLVIRLGALGTFCGAIGAAALWREEAG